MFLQIRADVKIYDIGLFIYIHYKPRQKYNLDVRGGLKWQIRQRMS